MSRRWVPWRPIFSIRLGWIGNRNYRYPQGHRDEPGKGLHNHFHRLAGFRGLRAMTRKRCTNMGGTISSGPMRGCAASGPRQYSTQCLTMIFQGQFRAYDALCTSFTPRDTITDTKPAALSSAHVGCHRCTEFVSTSTITSSACTRRDVHMGPAPHHEK